MKKYANEKSPLRGELFGAQQMEQYGRILATRHKLATGPAPEQLLKRLSDNEELLLEVHHLLSEAVKANKPVQPAGEWLLDNFYLIEEQIRMGKKHLPKGYSSGLPRLATGPSSMLPRVYDIALEIIFHSDGRVDLKTLSDFLQSYQTVSELRLGELWAIPIMLRLALIENLRRMAARIAIDRIYKNLADYWAGEILKVAEKDPKSLVLVIADMARSDPPMESAFVAELMRQLQGKGPTLAMPLTWIEQRLSENGVTGNELVQLENQKQAADQVSMSNSISSLRFLGNTNWQDFVEKTSVVEHILRGDASGIYPLMDFHTRDYYRHAVEKLAKRTPLSESQVAAAAIGLSNNNVQQNGHTRQSHVGYYLVDRGIIETEKKVQTERSFKRYCSRLCWRFRSFLYIGGIVLLSLFLTAALTGKAWGDGIHGWLLAVVALISFICVSQPAVTLVNWLVTLFVRPRLLPRLDFSKGILPEYQTMIVVPTMMHTEEQVDRLLEALEIRFLANRHRNLQFALLTDFPDAAEETLPGEDALLRAAKAKTEELNLKYGSAGNELFFLFHRPRKWNPREKKWMGYERKRGKLQELNALIKGNDKNAFQLIVGKESVYTKVRYIITLDGDTTLPMESAWKMIGCLAHPLNHAVYSERKQRVVMGYGILQPRVAVSLTAASGSLYASAYGNGQGIDPYTRASSDVYQDVFEEGSFIGKGIYDIDAFERACSRFPENRILSHDLLEGSYARSGLMSDVILYEEYPARYEADIKRRHRWIRGDWQIAAWVLPFVPGPDGRYTRNPLSALSRWKILDNLRRSLVPAALTLLLVLGWTALYNSWFWTLSVVAVLFLPSLITFTGDLLRKPEDMGFKEHIFDSLRKVVIHFIQNLFSLICLPYEAAVYTDAVAHTLWRLFITRRHLLEWSSSDRPEHAVHKNLAGTLASMWVAPVMAISVAVYLSIYYPYTLIVAEPVTVLWIFSPVVAWIMSAPSLSQAVKITEQQTTWLRSIARRTWAYFEAFVTEEENWLPPDNYQESPVAKIAHRTSPTNIGMALLGNLSAHDFGYITTGQLMRRTAGTLDTMHRLERYKGHLYNWYDTLTLHPLPPRYISTVDSGNLAGHLLTLRQGLLTVTDLKLIDERLIDGLRDTCNIVASLPGEGAAFSELFRRFEAASYTPFPDPDTIRQALETLIAEARQLVPERSAQLPENEGHYWSVAFLKQAEAMLTELLHLAPWLSLPAPPPRLRALPDTMEVYTFRELAGLPDLLQPETDKYIFADSTQEETLWLESFRQCLAKAAARSREYITTCRELAEQCALFADLEYDFLYDPSQHLLSIGYNAEEQRRDNSYYDLLASEARLGIYVAIAQGRITQESWFALGRRFTSVSAMPVLLSWSGSMFEYLMPLLVMPSYENTLLDQAMKGVIKKQIEHGKQQGVPWGISESGYNMVDANLNYQYRAFGVPGLGLKRGLGEDLVVAPYASVMALMVDPEEAYKNMRVLSEQGFEGKYGFYEAIDYTPSRLPRGQSYSVIRSFMVHHQGMSFLSLAYLLLNQPMQKRFQAEVQFKAAELLLQERVPKATASYTQNTVDDINVISSSEPEMRVITTPHTPVPEVQLLSNGRYHVMITNSGAGYSRWKDLALTRWREDGVADNTGIFCYLRDMDDGNSWSTAFYPTRSEGKNYEVVFSQGRAEFRRRDYDIETHTEIVVSPEDDIEMRRLHMVNRSRKRRTIEVTSYAEVVLNWPMADAAHPAFSNLFVQTEIIPGSRAVLCTRRPRSAEEKNPWLFHLMTAHGAQVQEVSYETDRMKFTGRGNTLSSPAALRPAYAKATGGDARDENGTLSGSEGSVLDPIVAIRYLITLEPQEAVTIDMIFGIGATRENCVALVNKYQDKNLADRVLELAWTHSQVVLRQINATEADAQLYGRLSGSVIYVNPAMRADPEVLIKNRRGQSGLWSHSISGDIPIVLVEIEQVSNIDLVKQMVQAHAFWRLKGLVADLVIWNQDHGSYRQTLHNMLFGLISPGVEADLTDRPGGIFIKSADQISNEDRILLQTVARVIITDKAGTLQEQINRRIRPKTHVPLPFPFRAATPVVHTIKPDADWQFYNGLGGFSANGKEYLVITSGEERTPAPWVNVLANPMFGTVVSESGSSYTWFANAHEYRLSPWHNDPVRDIGGEALYIRDEETGYTWSPTPLPNRTASSYLCRHGFGYSVFEHTEDGIHSEVWIYTDLEAAVKFTVVTLRNRSGRARQLSVTGYCEWVLGDLRHKYAMHVVTEKDAGTGALFANNPYHSEFGHYVSFMDADDSNYTYTTDRAEFLGRNGSIVFPDAMKKIRLSGKTGAGMDPCAAIRVFHNLGEDEEQDIIFRMGAAKDIGGARALAQQFRGREAAANSLQKVKSWWAATLGAVQVKTPDAALNLQANGWLLYQVIAARLWARSGFYQSGGAFGFRDQLQDVLAVLHTRPQMAREQILRSASRQFREGDAQHWWHPPAGRGVRTTCSDDYLWLPFVVFRYISRTGDKAILDEPVYFIEGRLLNTHEESYYDLPVRSNEQASLYEHCTRAIDRGMQLMGEHGLPLIGSGDWNDGMDKVGALGKGESVWLAFFLYDVLQRFSKLSRDRSDHAFAEKCLAAAVTLQANVEKHAWDGNWYNRAFFDDGTPLGSERNDECKIDSIAQSWSVLSGAGSEERARKAMDMLNEKLVDRKNGVIRLLDPAFDKSPMNPGYIKGYVPGVRENGGQYTHAAIWTVMAFAALRDRQRTWELLSMINPINHGFSAQTRDTYKVEPYVIAADVYEAPGHVGRGGWTWYTGSAGWMYQLIIESFIGLRLEGNRLILQPCLPPEWKSVEVDYRYGETVYHIRFSLSGEKGNRLLVTTDGRQQKEDFIQLADDKQEHAIEVITDKTSIPEKAV